MKNTISKTLIKKTAGFSLLEVLVALVVLSIGLLGLAALQAVALKSNHGAYQHSQATILAYDMMDRLRANRTVALAGSYELAMGDSPSANSTLAEKDIKDWIDNYVSVLLPAGDGSITCDNDGVCTVVIQWDESRMGGTATSSSSTASFTFTAEI